MTIGVIVACKDKFYIVADTITISYDYNYYTLNSQKLFYSDKHKLGLCVAGQENLISINLDRPSIKVSHVLRGFFQSIDSMDDVSVDNLGEFLVHYVSDQYPEYHNFFTFQDQNGPNRDNDISYFYGGFRTGATGQIDTVVYSHHNKQDLMAGYDAPEPYFANSNAVSVYINQALQTRPVHMSEEDALRILLDNHAQHVFGTIIPHACVQLNLETRQLDNKYAVVGPDLHRIIFTNTDDISNHRYIRYDNDHTNMNVYDIQVPNYTYYISEAAAIQNGEQAFDLINGTPLQAGTLYDAALVGLYLDELHAFSNW